MHRICAAFLAEFFELQLLLDFLLVTLGEMIDGVAHAAFHLDQIFSCHKIYLYN